MDPISGPFTTSCVDLELGPLSSTGITRLHRSYGPVRHPHRPGLNPRGLPVRAVPPADEDFPCRVALSVYTCCRQYPGGAPGRTRHSLLPWCASLPHDSRRGRPPHYCFRGLLNVHCSLRPA
jgi:hypothetical protein